MAKYRILRNSPHHKHREGDVVDLSKEDADKLIKRDPPLAAELTEQEAEALKKGEEPQALTAPVTEQQAAAAAKREAGQGAQMPGGPQAENITPEKAAEHTEKGLKSREQIQQEEAKARRK
jgi:hypothetical protein